MLRQKFPKTRICFSTELAIGEYWLIRMLCFLFLLSGLPCEAIVAPPHGHMNCSGLVTNETCSFRCEDGYDIQGFEKRICLNSSKWDGQQPSCIGNCHDNPISFASSTPKKAKQSFNFWKGRTRIK